jgi:hypothetical protein
MAGKGPEWRKGADLRKYYTNFPILSGEHLSPAIKIEKKKGKVTYTYE